MRSPVLQMPMMFSVRVPCQPGTTPVAPGFFVIAPA